MTANTEHRSRGPRRQPDACSSRPAGRPAGQAALLAALGIAAAVAVASAGPAWAAGDYYVQQWEIADKEAIRLDKDIAALKEDILEMNAKLGEHPTKQESEDVRRQAALSQARIDLKEDRIDFLESEIARLEKLSIESYKVDPDTEASLNKSLAALEEAYGQGRNFTASIDWQDREIVVTVPPDSTLAADELEAAISYSSPVRVEEEETLVLAACPRATSRCSPLEGGAQIWAPASNGTLYARTLGYRAVDMNGAVGFVTAAHDIAPRAQVTQPGNGRTIGTVTHRCLDGTDSMRRVDGRICDAAFVDLDPHERASSKVISTGARHYNIAGTVAGADQVLGTFLKISGSVTGVTYGSLNGIAERGNLNTIELGGTRSPTEGDSGAPVFKQPSTRSANVYLYGMFTGFGKTSGDAYYHTPDNIARQLGLR